MLSIFVNVVLPVFIVAGFGFVVQRTLHPSIAALNQVALYVLLPCLVFTSLLPIDFRSEEPIRVAVFAVLLGVAMLAVAAVIARAARMDRVTTSAFMLAVTFPNLGNYGLSVVLLAYGQEGVAIGLVLLAVQSLYGTALGIFIASSSSASPRQALRQLLLQPTIYAVAAALLFNLARIEVPQFIASALALPGQAAIPLMLLVLGMQLAGTSRIEAPRSVALAVLTRLALGALVGYGLVTALGIDGVARSVLVIGAAMPTAVFTTVIAAQYDARPRFVSDVVVASTIFSIITVTVVLALLTGSLSFPW